MTYNDDEEPGQPILEFVERVRSSGRNLRVDGRACQRRTPRKHIGELGWDYVSSCEKSVIDYSKLAEGKGGYVSYLGHILAGGSPGDR